MAVTIRAPSSTARASHGRGSSLTLGKKNRNRTPMLLIIFYFALILGALYLLWKILMILFMFLGLGIVAATTPEKEVKGQTAEEKESQEKWKRNRATEWMGIGILNGALFGFVISAFTGCRTLMESGDWGARFVTLLAGAAIGAIIGAVIGRAIGGRLE